MNPAELDDDGRRLLNQLFGKWSLLVLDALCKRPQRFSELRQHLPAVTPKSLTACLRRLERDGMVERVVVSTEPVAIEYGVTRLGRTLRSPLQAMMEWFVDHLDEVEAARSDYDEQRQPS
ncbi:MULTISPECIES: helix-turn-helix domain-containing protein [Streptomyces]|uniref:winged helix-turn-helix transcriptional regulator n=1 Tax=Streptomyces TaxID=1883 RepID=UPI002E16726E|nr:MULTISPECIES: helix-turn-helix domain-containing protein [Streptomyces]WSK38790.1 helix-turn-helix transcriptional regulator [Streptomyces tubercidicus]WSI53764.1 helix-turn-helix transcriptional regulator [Streptomyces platensis]WSX18952.1 helix-turn-helix transcriptional regulator [Streptomyces tubercidicus]WSX24582.1 helix-turn-helix transcriptional regulator [Streptomyces tubercidicus]WTI56336.1 helix-turn-helix transcriptional regulator [Streptomyces platensis]